MIATTVLRTFAIGIAVAAFIDPPFTVERPRRSPLTVVAIGVDAYEPATRVRDRMTEAAEVRVAVHDRTSHAAACPANGACVMVSRGESPSRVTAGSRLTGVVHAGDDAPRLLARIDTPSRVHRDAAAALRVETTRPARHIQILDGETVIGEARPNGNVTDIPFVPIGEGARALRVVADGDVADVGVQVTAARVPVLFYEPQATWLGSFVRRALEDDGRFAISGRTRLGPAISVSRGAVDRLVPDAIEGVSAIVVTAPELLTVSDIDLLERFVVRRGGSLVVVTDQRPAGAVLRILPRVVNEGSSTQPQPIGLLQASEWLTFESAAGVSTIAAIDQQPVVVAQAIGRGHVIISGALDAWRFRQASDDFDTFWTTLVWDAGTIAGPRLRVQTDRLLAAPGEDIMVTAELQTMLPEGSASDVTASAYAQCGDVRQFVRLWPAATPGTFKGTARLEAPGTCTLRAEVGDVAGTASVTIRDELQRVVQQTGELEALAAAHGAMFVTSGHEEELVGSLRAMLDDERQMTEYWPMRSALWLLPFAACLGGEWWLRRRSGLS